MLQNVIEINLAIRQPVVEPNNFEIKSAAIQMIQTLVQICGLPNEDPNAHISSFF